MLKQLIIDLYEAVNSKIASPDIHALIDDLLEENDLSTNEKVPLWFIDFIKNILHRKSINRTFFQYDPNQGDISNLIAELEDLIDAEWNDYGEAVEVTFCNLNLYACVSTEGNFYEIKTITVD